MTHLFSHDKLETAKKSPRVCDSCTLGDHSGCENVEANRGAVDAEEFIIVCWCETCDDGGTEVSYACGEWLHNCPGCACACHKDPKAREIWEEAFNRYIKSLDRRWEER